MPESQLFHLVPANPARSGLRHYGLWACGLLVLAWLATGLDYSLAGFSRSDELPGDIRRILHLSEFFAHGFGVAVIAAGVWCLAPNSRMLLPRILACAVWPGLIVNGLKLLIARQRPGPLGGQFPESIWSTFQGWVGWQGPLNSAYELQSFPSAHTATAFGMAIGLSWAFPRGRSFFWTLAILGSLQRIAANAHWLSDVLAGGAVAFLFAGALTHPWGAGKWLADWERRGLERLLAKGRAIESPLPSTGDPPPQDPARPSTRAA